MPSQAMQDAIDALRDRHKASAGQPSPTLAERRAAFVPGDRLHPVPDDVLVTEVTAGGVPAHWLAAAAAEAGVEVTLEIGEGLPHVCQLLLGTPEAAQATKQIGKFLRASTGELRPPSADAAVGTPSEKEKGS